MADDLHAVITAKLDELERIAKAATEEARGDWGDWLPPQTAEHFYAWDPTTVLRGLAEDRDILRRHRPSGFVTIWERGERYPQCTHGELDEEDELPLDAVRWDRCPEVLSVARRHGLDPS